MVKPTTKNGGKGRFGFPGPIAVLGALFVVSALLRLFDGIPQVWAATGNQAPQTPTMAENDGGQSLAEAADLQRVLDALRDRERALQAAETALAEKQAQVTELEQEAQARIAKAEQAEAALADTMATADQASEADLAQLTQVYERMKPKSAASLFEAMQPEFSAGFLGRMTPDAAAAILASMSPEAAYSVSAILAGRNALAGKP